MAFLEGGGKAMQSLALAKTYAKTGRGGSILTLPRWTSGMAFETIKTQPAWLSLLTMMRYDNRPCDEGAVLNVIHGTKDDLNTVSGISEHYCNNESEGLLSGTKGNISLAGDMHGVLPTQKGSVPFDEDFIEDFSWTFTKCQADKSKLLRELFGPDACRLFQKMHEANQARCEGVPGKSAEDAKLVSIDNPFGYWVRRTDIEGVWTGLLMLEMANDEHGFPMIRLQVHGSENRNQFRFVGVRDPERVGDIKQHVSATDLEGLENEKRALDDRIRHAHDVDRAISQAFIRAVVS